MAEDSTYRDPKNLLNAASTTPTVHTAGGSRLLDSSASLRKALETRNLYTEFDQYPLQNNDKQKIVNTIGTVLNTVAPFNSIDFRDTVISRLIKSPTTPLADIGLIMLGKQFTNNFVSNTLQRVLPTMSLRNMFDGNPETKLFQPKENFSITANADGAGSMEQFVEKFFGYHPRRENPFQKNPTNFEYMKNTGSGQLDFLFGPAANADQGGINRNLYKPDSDEYKVAAIASNNILADRVNVAANKSWFRFNDKMGGKYPFTYFGATFDEISIDDANQSVYYGYINTANGLETQGYGTSDGFIDDYLGRTTLTADKSIFSDFNEETGLHENIDQQIVWGKDGVSDRANNELAKLRGSDGSPRYNISPNDNINDFYDGKTGLLKYTAELLNSTRGQVVDQTRKLWKKEDKYTSSNGSALFYAPSTALPAARNKAGLRQHSILDQYDRFAKAIRFTGNQVYSGGNPNSVVFNSVLPRIHPTLDQQSGKINNKNLMFSLENLAVNVIGGDETFGIIDDEFGTQIPRCEVGQNNGRLMWFPPYDISINETAQAKYDTTAFVGRNEPIYTYMYSERAATLSFKLLIDYPEQVKNFMIDGDHKKVAEFFAFGGPDYVKPPILDNIPDQIKEKKKKIEEIEGPDQILPPEMSRPVKIEMVFPNDVPKVGNVNIGVVDKMYNDYNYEIIPDFISPVDGTGFGLNEEIYEITGVTGNSKSTYGLDLPPGFKQSTAPFLHGGRILDQEIWAVFWKEEFYKYFKIEILGRATSLYTPGIENPADQTTTALYNLDLGLRRAEVAKLFVQERIKITMGADALAGIQITTDTIGDVGSTNNTIESIPAMDAKSERSATISIVPRTDVPPPKPKTLTPGEEKEIVTLLGEIAALEKKASEQKRIKNGECVMNERGIAQEGQDDEDALNQGISKGFQSITENQFYPVFHSQTPEDFHKRLTFLQQCTRQGSAIRKTPEVDNYGTTRVKNSVFGRQPICILRVADFFHTKVIIESINIDYADTTWDTNPEGFGMQPMIAEVTLQMKVIGGQSLKGPIDALQNAVSFNYYPNSTFTKSGMYKTPVRVEELQEEYKKGIATAKSKAGKEAFDAHKQNLTTGNNPNNIYGYTEEDQ